jgi:hypothetical protein
MNYLKINESLILLGRDTFSLLEQTPELLCPCFHGQVITLYLFFDCLPMKINKTGSFDSNLNSYPTKRRHFSEGLNLLAAGL